MKRWTTGLKAALLLAMVPAFPAAADTPSTLVLVSGGDTDVSRDGGATWTAAVLVNRDSAWATIPCTAWIGDGAS